MADGGGVSILEDFKGFAILQNLLAAAKVGPLASAFLVKSAAWGTSAGIIFFRMVLSVRR